MISVELPTITKIVIYFWAAQKLIYFQVIKKHLTKFANYSEISRLTYLLMTKQILFYFLNTKTNLIYLKTQNIITTIKLGRKKQTFLVELREPFIYNNKAFFFDTDFSATFQSRFRSVLFFLNYNSNNIIKINLTLLLLQV